MLGRIQSFKYAFAGLRTAFQEEPNLRVHLIAVVLVAITGWYVDLTTTEWSVLVVTIGLVLCVELLNTAIENLCDHITPDRHPMIKKVKDVAAGAVLVSAIVAMVIALLIFRPHLFDLIGS